MLFLLGFLLLVLFCLTLLVRALLLFPLRSMRQGWRPALHRYGLSLLLCAGALLWELGALYGFSWQQLGKADRRQMVDKAIAFAYSDVYGDLAELRRDYAHFRPEVRYWGSWDFEGSNDVLDKLLGETHYQIRLPDLVVVADVHGRPLHHFELDAEQQPVAPDRPELGLVGEVDDLRVSKAVDDELLLHWSHPPLGEAEAHGNCFSAYSGQARNLTLELSAAGAAPLQFGRPLGFYRVRATLVPQDEYPLVHAQRQRISRAEFLRLRQACRSSVDEATRARSG
jgi:hypothetical protein